MYNWCTFQAGAGNYVEISRYNAELSGTEMRSIFVSGGGGPKARNELERFVIHIHSTNWSSYFFTQAFFDPLLLIRLESLFWL